MLQFNIKWKLSSGSTLHNGQVMSRVPWLAQVILSGGSKVLCL